jgi:menaquinol-cytochrome c reductase iron-sulfur subunit
MTRRDFYRAATIVLGNAVALVLAVPAVAYLLDPLRRGSKASRLRLAKMSELEVGRPRSFPVIGERTDAWVKYPKEPVGSVWLVRQPAGSQPELLAFTAECPHLGCAVNLTADGKEFLCPCHTSAFDLKGKPKNDVPPRGMDKLEVRLEGQGDPEIYVTFRRFRTQEKEQIPLA